MGDKPIRLAACEPCRQLKLACDHLRPVCSRCGRAGRSGSCAYRERPFKKRAYKGNNQTQASPTLGNTLENASPPSRSHTSHEPAERHYPNAGHLGLSSSATLFNHFAVEEDPHETRLNGSMPVTPRSTRNSDRIATQQKQVLLDVLTIVNGAGVKNLIDFWLAKSISLTLGGPFVESCTRSLQRLVEGELFDITDPSAVSRKLSENSARALNLATMSTLKDLSHEISDANVRWEAITLALITAGRAMTDIPFFPPLYKSRLELYALQRALTELSDRCLEVMLGLDSMNDIQLICQYENFILHSNVDGDQSYNAWRRLGDVISSLLFLGLNDRIADTPMIPPFLTELRRLAFAQIYSDDKNVAVFLGRPPRLGRNFCCFQLPDSNPDGRLPGDPVRRPMAALDYSYFRVNDRIDRVTGLRWTACCASLKEEILEALQEHSGRSQDRAVHFDAIYARAQSLWRSLPDRLRLERTLSPHEVRSPFENDFLLDMRLTYLQTLFLLRNSVVTHDSGSFTETEVELLQISQEILALIAEAIVLRDHLVNAGTSLLWKVVHYGLPAAGLICLFMLRPTFWQPLQDHSIPKILQDLGVLASVVRLGGLLPAEAPNYDLLYRAASTIQGLVSSALSCGEAFTDLRRTERSVEGPPQPEGQWQTDLSHFDLSAYSDLWGCEIGFWQDLGAHPSLLTPAARL